MHTPPPSSSRITRTDAQSGQSTMYTFCLNVTHNLTQIMLGAVVISALAIPNLTGVAGTFGQHIVLCTLGYFFLMTQAVLAFSPFGWGNQMQYEHRRIIHYMLQINGSIFVIVGSIIRMADVSSNFNSAHGITGIIAMILTACSLLGGLLSLIIPKQMNTKVMKFLHACVGIATLCLAFIALIYAFHNYYRSYLGNSNANTAIVLAVFSFIGTVLMASIKNVKRILNK